MRKSPLYLLLCGLAAAPVHAQEFDCLIEAREIVEIRSPVEALIEAIAVQRGDRVRKGQVVATMESRPERAALEASRARVVSVESTIQAVQARVTLAKQKLERTEKLFQDKFLSQNARDEAVAEAKLTEAQLQEATANRAVAQTDVQRNEALLMLRTLRSPIEGVVIDRFQRVGELATTDGKQPILKLAAVDPLHVEVVMPLTQRGKIRVKQHAQIRPENESTQTHTATVALVDAVVDARSGTFGVRLILPNPGNKVPAGIRCKARFE